MCTNVYVYMNVYTYSPKDTISRYLGHSCYRLATLAARVGRSRGATNFRSIVPPKR